MTPIRRNSAPPPETTRGIKARGKTESSQQKGEARAENLSRSRKQGSVTGLSSESVRKQANGQGVLDCGVLNAGSTETSFREGVIDVGHRLVRQQVRRQKKVRASGANQTS